MAEKEAGKSDAGRRKELLEIAAICRRVPEYPARTFHEALQGFWFTHIALHIEQFGWSISVGHFDQYMYPFYKADVESGKISKEFAFELLLNTWVKFMENVDAETLYNAQKNPDEYSDLVVRVAGYSAYFVTLSRDIQNEVISRTAHM